MAINQLTVGELVYKISGDMDNLKTELKKAETEITKLKGSVQKADESTSAFGSTFKKLIGGAIFAYLANQALNFGKASVQAYTNAQNSIMQFNNAQQNVAGTTKEQINGMEDYISELEKKTTVDDKTIRQGAQILAQDQIKIENQRKLLGGIVDIAVANSKANGGEVDVSGTAVAVGRAMATGDLGGLTRQNIVGVDDATAKMFKLGDQTKRTAILFKLLEENGKGAGEALAKSAQGDINRAKDKLEDIQKIVGKGLVVAFGTLTSNILTTSASSKDLVDKNNILGKTFVFVAGAVGLVINSLRLGFDIIKDVSIIVGDSALIIGSWGIDIVSNFKGVAKSAQSLGKSLMSLVTGDFKGAVENLKEGFDFSPSELTKNSIEVLKDDAKNMGAEFSNVSDLINKNMVTMTNAGKVYDDNAQQIDALSEAKDALNKKTEEETRLTDEEKKSVEALRDKVVDLKNKADDLVNSLGDKLVEATDKFKESVKGIVEDGTKSFVDIVLKAETDLADAQKSLAEEQAKEGDKQSADSIATLQETIKKKQAILSSYAQSQAFFAEQGSLAQKKADDASKALATETDPAKKANLEAQVLGFTAQAEAISKFADLNKQVDDARKLAGQDEFKQAEITYLAKLQMATDLYISETSQLLQKRDIALKVEGDITKFYNTQTALRQKTLDAFADASVTQLRRIGAEAQSAISALNSARSAGSQVNSPIIPVSTPSSAVGSGVSTSTATTNNTKTVNAPITINTVIKDQTDSAQIARDLTWSLNLK